MTVDLTKPVQTRDGRKARILATNLNSEKPIVGVVKEEDSDRVVTYYKNGRCYVFSSCPDDLVNVPERVSRWINLYWPCDYPTSRQEADREASITRTGIIEVIYEGDKLVDIIKHELETPIIEEAKKEIGE